MPRLSTPSRARGAPSLSAFDFRGDEAETARRRLAHSARARSRKRKRSVLGMAVPPAADAPEVHGDSDAGADGDEPPPHTPVPSAKRTRRTTVSRRARRKAAAPDSEEGVQDGEDSVRELLEQRRLRGVHDSPGARRGTRLLKPTRKARQAVLEAVGRRRPGGRAKRRGEVAARQTGEEEDKGQAEGADATKGTGDAQGTDHATPDHEVLGDSSSASPGVAARSEAMLCTPVKLRVRDRVDEEHKADGEDTAEQVIPESPPATNNLSTSEPSHQPNLEKKKGPSKSPAKEDKSKDDHLSPNPASSSTNPSTKQETALSSSKEDPTLPTTEPNSAPVKHVAPPPEPRNKGSVLPPSQQRSSLPPKAAIPYSKSTTTNEKPAPAKRVRFTEPQRANRSVRMNLHNFLKRKKRHERVKAPDVAIIPSGRSGPDEKSRQVLLDELQYVLDGIFKYTGREDKKPATLALITNSLQELTELLLRKPTRLKAEQENHMDEGFSLVLQILVTQPALLKRIVVGLFRILGKSRSIDLLVSLVCVIMFRSTVRILEVEESFLDSLIAGFLRNVAQSLKQMHNNVDSEGDPEQEASELESQKRNGSGRGLSSARNDKALMTKVNELVRKAGIKDEDFEGFGCESDGSAHLMALALSLLLEGHEKAREWMRKNQRVHRIVAVLYSCQKALQRNSKVSETPSEAPESKLQAEDFEEHMPLSLVTVSAMRVLEFATLDQVCRLRVATESRSCQVVLDFISRTSELEDGVVCGDPLICQALRLAINLAHDCKPGTEEFVKQGGPQVVLDCLAAECIGAGLIEGNRMTDDMEEAFDVRVLCLAFLISILDKENEVQEGFKKLRARHVAEREGGAIALVLELLKNVGKKQVEKIESKANEEKGMQGKDEVEDETVPSAGMEEKITTGYICLLLGALAHDCEGNKEVMKAALPQQSMLGVAAVLKEFLDFHHEVGVTSVAMDERYRSIISNLVKDAELPIPSLMESSPEEEDDEIEGEVEMEENEEGEKANEDRGDDDAEEKRGSSRSRSEEGEKAKEEEKELEKEEVSVSGTEEREKVIEREVEDSKDGLAGACSETGPGGEKTTDKAGSEDEDKNSTTIG